MWASINRSVSRKVLLAIGATTFVALALSAVALALYDARAYREDAVEDLLTQAELLALSNASALAFDDQKVATENLAVLSARPPILSAVLYRADGEPFASYIRPDEAPPPTPVSLTSDGYHIENGSLVLQHGVTHQGQRLGVIELRAQYEPFARLQAYAGILVLVMLASSVVALLVSARLRRAVTRPIIGMAGIARRIMDERDYSLRAQRTTEDEIGVLVDAFNGMLAQVEQHAGALEEANRILHREMRVRLEAERALRAADASKDEFLATLAHELRNPLAALAAATRLLTRAPDNPQITASARETLARQVEHMARLLEDLLDVARITRGKLALRREHVQLRAVIDAAVEASRPVIDAKNHQLSVELPDEPIVLTGDAMRLAQVISNLLTNAAKYTDAKVGRIAISAAREDHQVVIRVADNGIGIPAEALPKIFGMFSQVHSALDRAQGGLGIGLALAKGLVSLHGGEISADSEGPGQGSVFTVRLPINAEPVDAAQTRLAPVDATIVPRRILLADDNQDALHSLAMLLQMEGHEVSTARDGIEALEVGAASRPDVMLLDIGMPKLNGYEVARQVRKSLWGHETTLIAVTGWGQAEDKRRAAEAGFDHHMTKPIDLPSLQAMLAVEAADAQHRPRFAAGE